MQAILGTTPLVIVTAIGKDTRAIGKANRLLWHIPDDLKRFKALTLGHPIIMGRKTFESIVALLGGPLPSRTNIVITNDPTYVHEGAIITNSLEEAVQVAKQENPAEIHIGGGGMLYQAALPFVSKLHVTWIYSDESGDTFFPLFERDFKIVTTHPAREYKHLCYQWIDYQRT